MSFSIYSNILATAYKFYGRFKNENPYSRSIILVSFCQMSIPLFIIAFVKKVWGILILPAGVSKYYYAPFLILWMIFDFIYFSKKRVARIILQFDDKTEIQKRLWAVVTIISLLIPFLVIPLLLIKHKP
ncbi:MAG: hypothetical protein ABUT20_07570 [Bacteroidota bacterium]